MLNVTRLIELLYEAKTRPDGAERDSFVDSECGDDAELKEQLLSLLAADAYEAGSDFLTSTHGVIHSRRMVEKSGDWIGPYKLLEQIGEGGCGIVYMAEQERPVRRRVALKVIKFGMDTKQVIARFEAERQALAMMEHANIAKVFDGGATETGRPYFVMELVHGVSLTAFCDEARLSTRERLQLFIGVCQAVQHAHQKGIIHRDLKPSNILVTINDGVPVPKVIDFGIAKATGQGLTGKTLFTQCTSFIGTPAYTSPEQAEMSTVDIDTRSDIYSLGVLLYELLTGRTPFNSEALLSSGLDELRRIIRHQEPPRPSTCLSSLELTEATTLSGKRQSHVSELSSALRGDLDCIVMKCLEKDRSRRYETVGGLARDIERHLNSEPITARPRSGIYLLQKLARRHKGVLIGIATVLLVLVGAVLILSMSNVRIRRERNQKEEALASAREQLFQSLQSQAQARRRSRQTGQRTESLAALAQAARIRPTPELRDNAIAAMAIPDIEEGPIWPLDNQGLADVSYDSAYRHYARLAPDGTISISTIPEGRELQRLISTPLVGTGRAGGELSFSPDGQLLARAEASGRISVWKWEIGASILNVSLDEYSGALAFSPDSQRLALGHEDWITCFDLSTGKENRRWQVLDRVHTISFRPNDRDLAVGYSQSNVVSIYNAMDGTLAADLPIGPCSMTSLAWHPSGDFLATAGSDPRIQIWDVNARRRISVLEGHVEHVNFLMFHRSGELLVSMAWDNVMRIWEPFPGRLLMKLPPRWMGAAQRGHWTGAVQLDGARAQLWGLVQSQEYHTFLNSFAKANTSLREGGISPDGRLLALGASDGVRLWNIDQGNVIAHLAMGNTTCATFRASGRELLTCGADEGLRRWSLLPGGDAEGGLELGAPRPIPLPFPPLRMSLGQDDRTLAIAGERTGECAILDLDTEELRVPKMTHRNVAYVTLNPDGTRLATSGWHSEAVMLWNAQTGALLKELGGALTSAVFFTPANELIVSHGLEFTFHTPDSLAVSRRLPREIGLYAGHVAFTGDGKMMAMEIAPGVIHLKEATSGRTLAKLEDPQGDVSTWMSFTPDGMQLVVAARYAGAIHRWDLRAIRSRLKAMNLDWDWPESAATHP